MPRGKRLIVKPAIGFLSLGVRRIDSQAEWQAGIKAILDELDSCKGMFDESVLRDDRFIVEDYIFGEKYACDGYYDRVGRPVIMLICKHLFRDEKDTRDVVYYTDARMMERLLPKVSRFMSKISAKRKFRHFPFHFEFRIIEKEIHAIEINPIRFGGFGLADLSYFAFGVNSYVHFFEQKKPEWSARLENAGMRCYAFVLGRVPPQAKGRTPDHRAFKASFRNILDYGLIDYQKYPAFCRVLAEGDSPGEFEKYLRLDFSRYFL